MSKTSIRELRQSLGLSQSELGTKVGVSRDTVRRWEYDASTPQKLPMQRLQETFSDTDLQIPKKPRKSMEEKKTTPSSIAYKFTVGKYYNISDWRNLAAHSDFFTPILRYERKEGIHHVFRETRGNWITTYTDAQLVGKNIKEVTP